MLNHHRPISPAGRNKYRNVVCASFRNFRWNQVNDPTIATTNFSDVYDPTSATSGAVYQGNFSLTPAPATLPGSYRDNMRLVTVTVYWTNYNGKIPIVHTRQMQTLVAEYGIQNYSYK